MYCDILCTKCLGLKKMISYSCWQEFGWAVVPNSTETADEGPINLLHPKRKCLKRTALWGKREHLAGVFESPCFDHAFTSEDFALKELPCIPLWQAWSCQSWWFRAGSTLRSLGMTRVPTLGVPSTSSSPPTPWTSLLQDNSWMKPRPLLNDTGECTRSVQFFFFFKLWSNEDSKTNFSAKQVAVFEV